MINSRTKSTCICAISQGVRFSISFSQSFGDMPFFFFFKILTHRYLEGVWGEAIHRRYELPPSLRPKAVRSRGRCKSSHLFILSHYSGSFQGNPLCWIQIIILILLVVLRDNGLRCCSATRCKILTLCRHKDVLMRIRFRRRFSLANEIPTFKIPFLLEVYSLWTLCSMSDTKNTITLL